MFGCLEFAGPDAPCVMTGSHLDSQPFGGRFDGAYGVVAGLAAASALREAHRARDRSPTANLVVSNWTNEEGARFQPSLIGSSVYEGSLALKMLMP
jgi:beta-ureidopropionase / N-carbamoyl-L-amino-acid hydrolase